MATLKDVARAAGVSRSTASYVYNNPERVGRTTRLRVEAAARQLGFAGPDPMGRLLRAGKVNAIGVIAPGVYNMAGMFTGYFPRSWRASRKFATSSAPISPLFPA